MKNRFKIQILIIFITMFFGIFGLLKSNILIIIGGGMICIIFMLICLYLDLCNYKVNKWLDKTKF